MNSHSIPVHSRATAIVNKTVEFRFRSILKTLIEAKYHEHPQTKDNIHQCKIMIGELEKMLFKMT